MAKEYVLGDTVDKCLCEIFKNLINIWSWWCGQTDSVEMVEQALQFHNIKYEKSTIDENGIVIEQVFFHDPDGFMIEICTCEKFPVQPLNVATAELCNLVRTLSRRKSGLPINRSISRANTGEKLNILDQLKACYITNPIAVNTYPHE